MSALDIAGAVVWTPIAFILSGFLLSKDFQALPNGDAGLCGIAWLGSCLGSAFCIARLFGAHL